MTKWNFGINSFYRTASYYLEEAPWYIFLVRWIGEFVCDHIPAIPFPAIAMRDDAGERTNWNEYYGDFSQWWHVAVHDPVFEWADKRIKTIIMPVPYEDVRSRHFTDNKKFFEEAEAMALEIDE